MSKWIKNTDQIIVECKNCGLWFDCEGKPYDNDKTINPNCELQTFRVKKVKWKVKK